MSGSSTATDVLFDAPFVKRPFEARMRIDGASAPHVLGWRRRNLHVGATTDEGGVIMTITCGQGEHGLPVDLLPWLLGWDSAGEVVAPEHVRAHVAREQRAATANDGS